MDRMNVSKLLGIQYLRAVAALMVVWFHATVEIPQFTQRLSDWGPFSTTHLQFGVHIFFVISGFIMMVTTVEATPGDFFFRRLSRIVPLYWLLTAVVAAAILLPPHFFQHTTLTTSAFFESIFFIPHHDDPILVPGWTLNVEMFFYLVFAGALLVPLKMRLMVVGCLFTALVVIGQWIPIQAMSPAVLILTRPWMLEFVIGMGLGQLWLWHALIVPRPLCGALIGGGFVALLCQWPESAMAARYIVPSAAIVVGCVAWEQNWGIPRVRLLALLGDSSYSLYLSHVLVLAVVKVVWEHLRLVNAPNAAAAFVTVSVIASVLCGIALYRVIELPVLKALQSARRNLKVRLVWVGENLDF